MSFGKALYFPYIHFQDENWLKYSLLYWDGLKRIVPEEYTPADSKTVKALLDENIIENVNPKDGKVPYTMGAAEQFLPTFKQMLQRRHDKRTPATIVNELLEKREKTPIDIRKMDSRVVDVLSNYEFAIRDGNSLIMDPKLAGFYMVCLAGHISEEQKAPLVTDTFEMETIGTYFQHSRISQDMFRKQYDKEFQLTRMLMPVPSPQNLKDIDIKKFIKFQKKYEAERTQFRKAIEGTCKGISDLDDQSAIKDFLEQKKKEIKTSVDDQRKAIRGLNAGNMLSLCSISVPTGVSSLAGLSAVNPISVPLIAGLGLTVVFLTWLVKSSHERSKTIRNCDWHYLLRMEKKFNTRQIASDCKTWYEDILID